ncbi:MAG TPA: RNA-binding cell elongation regulator Jag/EloR [Candidatus Binataceae bacterium]|nr:RNA-binding cell elongation regulator Jag/EloR [Candidatus Binataceae bacterium]
MSESNQAIEVTAPSVDEAISQALEKLGASEDDVIIQVLSTPRAGVLGLGVRQARVRVERRAPQGAQSGVMSPPPAPPPRPRPPSEPASASAASGGARPTAQRPVSEQPAPEPSSPARASAQRHEPPGPPPRRSGGHTERRVEAPASTRHEERATGDDQGEAGRKTAGLDDQVREARAILSQILELMGERGEITTTEEDSEGIELAVKGDGSGLLIGRHGQTLDALEYLVNRILARRVKDAVPITVDTESYRERRRRQLHRMALAMAEQTKREHTPVTLDPMPPRDRRIVHLALKDDPLITTRSTGDGFLRVVEIIPVGERREGGGARGRPRGAGTNEGRGGRVHERPREPEPQPERDQPVGEQGGFKHGQKRMF